MSRGARFLAIIVAMPLPVTAQGPARVIGRVLDAATGGPVTAAELQLGDQRATSASDGAFILVAVAPGRATLSVRRLGYTSWAEVVDVVQGLDRDRELTALSQNFPDFLSSLGHFRRHCTKLRFDLHRSGRRRPRHIRLPSRVNRR